MSRSFRSLFRFPFECTCTLIICGSSGVIVCGSENLFYVALALERIACEFGKRAVRPPIARERLLITGSGFPDIARELGGEASSSNERVDAGLS